MGRVHGRSRGRAAMPLGLLGGAATSTSSVRVQASFGETREVGGRCGRTASMAHRPCSSARRRQRGAGGVTRACPWRPGWPESMAMASLTCRSAEVASIGAGDDTHGHGGLACKREVGTAIRVLRPCPTGERVALFQRGAATASPAAAFLLFCRARLWRQGGRSSQELQAKTASSNQ